MSLLITLLVFVIFLAILFWILRQLPIPQPWMNIMLGVFALIALLVIASHFGYIRLN